MSLKEIYFVRHGETDMNVEKRCQGRIDAPLNETGRRQVEEASENFRGVKVDSIYASPLSRAMDSAAPISRITGLPITPLEWLMEFDHGELEGMNSEEADAACPGIMDTWINRPHEAVFPGGETLEDVGERVSKGILELAGSTNGTAAAVTHQVITGVARCLAMGEDFSHVWDEKLLNGEYLRIELTPEKLKRLSDFLETRKK